MQGSSLRHARFVRARLSVEDTQHRFLSSLLFIRSSDARSSQQSSSYGRKANANRSLWNENALYDTKAKCCMSSVGRQLGHTTSNFVSNTDANRSVFLKEQDRFRHRYLHFNAEEATRELNSILELWFDGYTSRQPDVPNPRAFFQWIDGLPFRPGLKIYDDLLDRVVRKKSGHEPQCAEMFLRRMVDQALNPLSSGEFDKQVESEVNLIFAFNKVMTMYCQSNDSKSAERLLKHLEKLHDDEIFHSKNEDRIFVLTRDTYSIVISGWARQGSPREAEYVLNWMLNRAERAIEQGRDDYILPSKDNFESCLGAWVKGSSIVSGQRAELLLLRMLELYERPGIKADTAPCVKSFSKTVLAWVHSRHKEAANRADSILLMLQDMETDTKRPDRQKTLAHTYLQVLQLWSASKRRDAPEKCHDLISRLEEAVGLENIESVMLQKIYAAQIASWGWSDRRDTTARVQQFIDHIENRQKAGLFGQSDCKFYWHISIYHARFLVYSRMGDGTQAESLLKQMLNDYVLYCKAKSRTGTNVPPIPDSKSFNCVLLAWSRSTDPGAQRKAEELFLQMKGLQGKEHFGEHIILDIVSYNAILTAFGKNDSIDVARRGNQFFEELRDSRVLKLTTVTYTLAILLWSNVRSPESLQRAYELLAEMMTGGKNTTPDHNTFKALVVVIQNSDLSDDEKNQRILDLERKLGMSRNATKRGKGRQCQE